MQLRGVNGRLERGYVVAAELGAFTVTREKDAASCQLTAKVARIVDAFQLTQPGLRFVTPLATRLWTWRVEAHTVAGGTLTAVLSGRPVVE